MLLPKGPGIDTGQAEKKQRNYTIAYSELSHDGEPMPEEGPEVPSSNTICAFCNQDFGDTPLGKLSVYNICDNCKVNIDKQIFPLWVKGFFAAVLILVIFSIFWNWRFFMAYHQVSSANAAFVKGDVANAAYYMKKASDNVPDVKDIAMIAVYFDGIYLLTQDKSAAALAEFNRCKDNLPADLNVKLYLLQAEMGAAYDAKNYPLFVSASKEWLQTDTTKSMQWASVASAYACMYAQNGADSSKQQAMKYLNRAKAIDSTSADSREYTGRIMYRIDSRQVISIAEYHKKFPKGYLQH
jgi:hypothetical protein